MNPHGNTHPCDDVTAPGSLPPPSPPPYARPDPYNNNYNNNNNNNSDNLSRSVPVPCSPVPQTENQNCPSYLVSSGHSSSPLCLPSNLAALSSATPTRSEGPSPPVNPYTGPTAPPFCQVSIIQSPDLRLSPLQPQYLEDTCPDMECSICFSQFNNVFRCPKMLQCKHTFCLECLARINVKSVQPNSIQCPLCRGLTSLPTLGLPRLATDSNVLSCLPAAMQRVYSIRFLRSKGKLQVKRSSEGRSRWVQSRSLDVGLPSPPIQVHDDAGVVGGALFRLTAQPVCRTILLTFVVTILVVLISIIIYLLTFSK